MSGIGQHLKAKKRDRWTVIALITSLALAFALRVYSDSWMTTRVRERKIAMMKKAGYTSWKQFFMNVTPDGVPVDERRERALIDAAVTNADLLLVDELFQQRAEFWQRAIAYELEMQEKKRKYDEELAAVERRRQLLKKAAQNDAVVPVVETSTAQTN